MKSKIVNTFQKQEHFAESRSIKPEYLRIQPDEDINESEGDIFSEMDFYAENINDADDTYSTEDELSESSDDDMPRDRRSNRTLRLEKRVAQRPRQRPLNGRTRPLRVPPGMNAIFQQLSDVYSFDRMSMATFYHHAFSRVNKERKAKNLPRLLVTTGEFLDRYKAFLNMKIDLRSATNEQLASLKVPQEEKPRAPRATISSAPITESDKFDGIDLTVVLAGRQLPLFIWVSTGCSALKVLATVRKCIARLQADPNTFRYTIGGKKLDEMTDWKNTLETYGSVRVEPLGLGGAGGKKGRALVNDRSMVDKKKKKKPVSIIKKVGRGVRGAVAKVPRLIAPNLSCLSPCAQKLLAAIADPFCAEAVGCCGLVDNTQPSHKVSFYQTITNAGCGTSVGSVVWFNVTPCLANDGICAFFPTVTANNGQNQVLTANNTVSAGWTTATPSGLPYSTSQLSSGASNSATNLQGRVLSMGVRMTYSGTELNMGGTYLSVHRTNHENCSVVGGSVGTSPDTSGVANWEGTMSKGVTRDPVLISIFPVNSAERNYSSNELEAASTSELIYPFCRGENEINGFTYTQNGVLVGCPIALGAIQPPSGIGATINVEMVIHCEYVGSLARASSTRSEADPVGHDIVMNAAARFQNAMRQSPKANPRSVIRELAISAISHVSSIPPSFVRGGMKMLHI